MLHNQQKTVSGMKYNKSNSFLFVNAVKMYIFKAKHSEVKPYPLCLSNILKDFAINSMKKTELKEDFFLLIIKLLILTIFQISIDN